MARFSDAEVTVVESGAVRATIKVSSRYNDSRLSLYVTLCAGDESIYIRGVADWHEKHKMLKLSFPLQVENPVVDYEIPYGMVRRPADGEEEPGLSFIALRDEQSGCGFAFANDSTYSSSTCGGEVRLTVLRSPIYADHGGSREGERDVTEQGLREFRFVILPVTADNAPAIRAARVLNAQPVNIVENWHEGKWQDKVMAGISIDANNVLLSALKRSEDGCGTVVRLYEVEGRETAFCAEGIVLPAPLRDTISPFSVETYYLADGSTEWKRVLLTEM
jgi:alpha-mannosidase